jgi:transposase
MRLNKADREAFRKRLESFFVKNPELKKSKIVEHFVKEGIAEKTVYNNIDRLQNHQPIQDKKRTGRPSTWTTKDKAKLKRLVNNRKGVSQRKLSKKFAKKHRTIGRQLKKMKICYRKREKTPKYTEEQKVKAKKRSRKLVNQLYKSKSLLILDDEKYFCFSGDHMPGNAGYYTNCKNTCPEDVRFIGEEKFPKKLLMWIAISERGISKPLFRTSKSVAINSSIYISECLEARLLPFIHKYHGDFNYLFWPDLASSHYSKESVAWMNEYVNYVDKESNPPNVPQAKPK